MIEAAPSRRARAAGFAGVAGVFAATLAWRARAFAADGLVHYDEGVYAITAQAVRAGLGIDAYHPQQALHAPPLFPWLAGVAARACDVPATDALRAVSVVAAAAAAALVFAGVRRAAGVAAGLAAAACVAGDGMLDRWGRAGLVDATFVAALAVAGLLYAAAERRASRGYAALFGLAAAVAANVKYVGWLAVPAAALASAAQGAFGDPARRRGVVGRLALAAAVAGLGRLPWFLAHADGPTDAAVVAGQHDRFLDAAHWARSFLAQCGYHAQDASVAIRLAAFLALAAAWAAPAGRRALRAADPFVAFAAAAAAVWCALVPAYHPYPRLAAPALYFAYAASVGLAGGLGRRARSAVVVGAALLAAWGAANGGLPPGGGGFRDAAGRLAEAIPAGARAVVLAEPVVAAYLRERGVAAEILGHPWQALDGVATETLVVSGYYVRRGGAWEGYGAARSVDPPVILVAPATVGAVRLADDFLPADLAAPATRDPATYALELRRAAPRR